MSPDIWCADGRVLLRLDLILLNVDMLKFAEWSDLGLFWCIGGRWRCHGHAKTWVEHGNFLRCSMGGGAGATGSAQITCDADGDCGISFWSW